jgi:mono/diheme cytochrome c family protein
LTHLAHGWLLITAKRGSQTGKNAHLIRSSMMTAFGVMMNDDQISAVVNYVRTHFGNAYKDAVTPEDVKVVRP